MRGGVSSRGAVAATHMTAGLTHAEMDPIPPTCGDAVLASRRGGIGILDLINVSAHRLAHMSLHTCPSGTEPGRGLVVGRVRGALTILIVKHTGSTDAGGSVGWRGGRYPMIGNDPCCQPIIPGDPDPAMGAVAKDVA